MGGSKRLHFLILLGLGLGINLIEAENPCQESTQGCYDTMCHENHLAGRHTNSPQVQLTNISMCTCHKWLPPRQNVTIPGAGGDAVKGCPSSTQPCQASAPAGLHGCPDMRPWTFSTHHVKAENHTNQRMLGLCKMLWGYERYTKSKPMNYCNSHQWFYSSAAQMDFSSNGVETLLIKNCLVGRWEKVMSDGSRVHVVHLLITRASKKAFLFVKGLIQRS